MTLEITDMMGQILYKAHATAMNGAVNEQILLPGSLIKGMYMLNVHTASETRVYHFAVEQ